VEEEEAARRVHEYTEQMRGRSLYAEHQAARRQGGRDESKKEEDDPSARAFDKEKDMGLGRRIGAAERRELLNRAAGFGDRFTKGSFL